MTAGQNRSALFAKVALAVLAVCATELFVYNSGFGYDAFEYLVIGRSLNEGYRFFAFVPSKSWGIYALVAAYLRVPYGSTHLGVSLLVTAILLLVCAATFQVVRRRGYTPRAALLSAVLVGAAALFMELNYLEPTGLVYLAGLMSFAAVTGPGADRRAWPWLAAGAWVGVGTAFKSVAVLYLVGLILWSARRMWADDHRRRVEGLEHIALMMTGCVAVIAAQAVYFWLSGRFQPYVEWTFTFPLLYYPAHVQWLSKLYTKLLWVWLVVAAAIAASFDRRIRLAIQADDKIQLLLVMGAVSLVSLLKTQSSHYAFPGAAFLLIGAAVVADQWLARCWKGSFVAIVTFGAVALTSMLVSVALYRPAALLRLVTVRQFDDEERLATELRALVPPGAAAIFLEGGTKSYWFSGHYPVWPVLNTDVQTTYFVQHRAAKLLATLDAPGLQLVEFNPRTSEYDDERFFAAPESQLFLQTVQRRLESGFTRHDTRAGVFWTRAASLSSGR